MNAAHENPSAIPVIMLNGTFGVPWTRSARGSSLCGRRFPMSPWESVTTTVRAAASKAPATAAFASSVMISRAHE